MRRLLIPIIVASVGLGTVPVSAQLVRHYVWDSPRGAETFFQREINQLNFQIERSLRFRAISPREATRLRRDAASLQRQYNVARRGGINRREAAQLDQRLFDIHTRLRMERWNRR